jgi:hypothetical protein
MSISKMTWMAAAIFVGVCGSAVTSFADTATDTTSIPLLTISTPTATRNHAKYTSGPSRTFEGLYADAGLVRPNGLLDDGLMPTNPDAQG